MKNIGFLTWGIKDLLTIVSYIIIAITVGYELKKKEEIDESAKKIFGKVDGIFIQSVMWLVVVFIIFVDTTANSSSELILYSVKNMLCLMVF